VKQGFILDKKLSENSRLTIELNARKPLGISFSQKRKELAETPQSGFKFDIYKPRLEMGYLQMNLLTERFVL
jgi:hypothetical protein